MASVTASGARGPSTTYSPRRPSWTEAGQRCHHPRAVAGRAVPYPLVPHPGARRAEVGRGARVRMSAMIQVAALHGVTARPVSGDPGETSVRERCGG